MLLAIDARNRAISAGFLDNGRQGRAGSSALGGSSTWLARRRLGAIPGRSADEYAILFKALALEAGEGRSVDSCWMSCVVPALGAVLARAVDSAFGVALSLVGPGTKTGVRIRTDVPSEVGSDLVCAAAAAREFVKGPSIVVDFDVAIAFSAIGRAGDFLGAAIAPGLGTAAEALRANAALLPGFSLGLSGPEAPFAAIGRTTAQSLRSGLGIGYAGLVASIVAKQREELAALGEADSPEAVQVIGTGDEEGRELLASLGLGRFVPELVLEGLAVIAARADTLRKIPV
jgi:type III pantothenate kinase